MGELEMRSGKQAFLAAGVAFVAAMSCGASDALATSMAFDVVTPDWVKDANDYHLRLRFSTSFSDGIPVDIDGQGSGSSRWEDDPEVDAIDVPGKDMNGDLTTTREYELGFDEPLGGFAIGAGEQFQVNVVYDCGQFVFCDVERVSQRFTKDGVTITPIPGGFALMLGALATAGVALRRKRRV